MNEKEKQARKQTISVTEAVLRKESEEESLSSIGGAMASRQTEKVIFEGKSDETHRSTNRIKELISSVIMRETDIQTLLASHYLLKNIAMSNNVVSASIIRYHYNYTDRTDRIRVLKGIRLLKPTEHPENDYVKTQYSL